MSTAATDYIESLAGLSPGESVVFHDVDFEDYRLLLQELGESSHLRISYSNGRLEVMSPRQNTRDTRV